jgi:hypothetical protein
MRGDELLDILEYVDPSLIEEADQKPKANWLRWTAVAACVALVIGIGALCWNTVPGLGKRYKRISFSSESLGVDMQGVTADTVVTYNATETFQSEMPIYKISKHPISETQFDQMEEQLGITKWYLNKFNGYTVYSRVAPYSDPIRGAFSKLNLTDAELEKLAWETFHKIPFLEGEYEYAGETGYMSQWTQATGEIVTEVTVSFRRKLDGITVIGNERCEFTFDASGLVEIYIVMHDYKKIGTMDMISLSEAKDRITTPDSFAMDTIWSGVKELNVDRVKLFLVNQYSRGCTILQPMYTFYGMAHLENGEQEEFRSKVIAIPEELTYEE